MSPETAVGQPEKSSAQTKVQDLSLFRIEHDLIVLIEAREEAEDQATLDACDQAIAEYCKRELVKVDGIIAFIRHCESVIQAAKTEEERIKNFRRIWEDRLDRIRLSSLLALQTSGKKSVEGRTGKLSVRGNGGKAPLDVYDQSQIPAKYEVVTVEVDRTKIREDLERGAEVPGARLLDRGTHLHVT